MNEGITIDEACANNVIGTKEDFERSCNADGTVKSQVISLPKTITFSLKNDQTKSITVNSTYVYLTGAGIISVMIVGVIVIIRKIKSRKLSK